MSDAAPPPVAATAQAVAVGRVVGTERKPERRTSGFGFGFRGLAAAGSGFGRA